MQSLFDNDVWDLVELPPNQTPVGSKWVYKTKTGSDGEIERYKARLVAKGYTQKSGMDYDETFCPVVRQESLRTLVATALQKGLKLHQIDVSTAFLNGTLQEEVYMQQPEGFVKKGEEHLVCKLRKSIYGLKQAPRCWNMVLDAYLKDLKFVQSASDPCIYVSSENETFYLGVYVDDIVLAGESETSIQRIKDALSRRFDIKDMGSLRYFLGMTISQSENEIWIGQPKYTSNLVKKFGMQDCKPVSTPIDPSTQLEAASSEDLPVDQEKYQSVIGSLMYLSVSTRPDISFAVGNLARFSAKPTKAHWNALKRVVRYLKGTVEYGLKYVRNDHEECSGYSDADWAGDVNDRKSTSGYVFMLSGGAITWKSKKQTCVALSTAEAEYIALSASAQESIWLRQILTDLGNPPTQPTTLYEDNQSAIAMAKNPQFHGRAKHIDIKCHYIRDQVQTAQIQLTYCPTEEMIADIFTKGLSRDKFEKLRDKAGIVAHNSRK